jgi:protein-disulfide isomerase
MIPFRMLNHGSPSKNLHTSGYCPPLTQGHWEQNYARLQAYRRHEDLNLNMAKFTAALDDPKIKAGIEADSQLGSSVGANGTPTFFINGRTLVGAQPYDSFAKLIDEELARRN